ncbi:MAG: sulfate/molybdate ABC transporter ATP-binding protein [Acidobacteria bacterium]|nr:sulfate/molybdate ABC transporter ATP-binding protein [Acidobacteriota bacterium]
MKIELQNINKTFGSFKALNDISLTIESGELVALLGPSGSGKTTLLRIMAGLDFPDSGSGHIMFDGVDVNTQPLSSRGVGFVFQHYALFKHMTVFDNIAFGLNVRSKEDRPSKNDIKDKVTELLHLIHLEDLANRLPHQLSGGQRQRVALARALAVEPHVLLLDEPFGALDAKVRLELRRWLRRLHDEIGITSVFVTHDQTEALDLSSRIAVINNGRLEQIGTPEEIFHKPKTEFVLNFLGEVNFFRGVVGKGKIRIGNLKLEAPEYKDQPEEAAHIFIRPHQVEIITDPKGKNQMAATITRMHAAGSFVRLELKTETDDDLYVDLTPERFEELNLANITNVYVTPKNVLVFIVGKHII